MAAAEGDRRATLGDIANFTTKWYIESGGLTRGSYSGRRLRVAVGVQRRSEGEKDLECEVRAAREQGDVLELRAHRLGVKGADALARELRADRTIRTVVLSDTGLGHGGAAPVADALLHNACITALTLQLNGIGDAGACALAHGLATGSTCNLSSLALEEEGIGEAGTRAIAAALSPRGPQRGPALALLTQLSLRGNPISTAGAAALAAALQVNSGLESLDLCSCSLTGLGAARLAEVLPHNCTLRELRLVRNGIPVTGALALAAGLLHNEGLEILHLGANPCGPDGWLGYAQTRGGRPPVPGLIQAIGGPPLTDLSLFGTGLGNAGMAELARYLADGKCALEVLDLGDNHLSSVGVMELAKVLPKQGSLTSLGLWGNSIGSAGKPDADALARGIQRNKCLLSVALHGNPIEARPMPMGIIKRALDRNQKHAENAAKEAVAQAASIEGYLSRSSSSRSVESSSRSLSEHLSSAAIGTGAGAEEGGRLLPDLNLNLAGLQGKKQKKRPKPVGVSVGLAGATPREVRQMDADGHTGHTPRPDDQLPEEAAVVDSGGGTAGGEADELRLKVRICVLFLSFLTNRRHFPRQARDKRIES